MKETLGSQLKQMLSDGINYIKLQIEEGKLIGAQKASVFISAAAVSIICLVLGMFIIFLCSLALVAVFKTLMAEWLAYLAAGGALLVLLILLILLRKPLIINPVCKFLTRLLFDNEPK